MYIFLILLEGKEIHLWEETEAIARDQGARVLGTLWAGVIKGKIPTDLIKKVLGELWTICYVHMWKENELIVIEFSIMPMNIAKALDGL